MYVLNSVISPKQTNAIDAIRACGPRYFVFEEVMLWSRRHTLSSADGPNMKLSIFVVKMEKVTCQYVSKNMMINWTYLKSVAINTIRIVTLQSAILFVWQMISDRVSRGSA